MRHVRMRANVLMRMIISDVSVHRVGPVNFAIFLLSRQMDVFLALPTRVRMTRHVLIFRSHRLPTNVRVILVGWVAIASMPSKNVLRPIRVTMANVILTGRVYNVFVPKSPFIDSLIIRDLHVLRSNASVIIFPMN